MDTAELSTNEIFDEDYLYFYDTFVTGDRSDSDVGVIWNLLELQPGQRVLDLPCGTGRIANGLAHPGCSVVCLDESELLLEQARRDAPSDAGEIAYVRGDIRYLAWEAEFDTIINWFTSFGYFASAEVSDRKEMNFRSTACA